MNMWSMRVFKLDGLADLGQGLECELALGQNGVAEGRVTNRTGFPLTRCEVRLGTVKQPIGDLPDGASADVRLKLGRGQPAQVSAGVDPSMQWQQWQQSRQPGGNMPAADQMRAVVNNTFLGPGMAWATRGGAILTGWCDKRFTGLAIAGKSPAPTHKTFLIVHVPLATRKSGPVLVAYGTAGSAVTEERGANRMSYESGIDITDGFITTDFHLPLGAEPFTVDRLEVSWDFMGVPGNLKLQVYNWRTGGWDTLATARGKVPVPEPAAHVDVRFGLVRVKLIRHPSGGGGGPFRLQVLDVLVKGHR